MKYLLYVYGTLKKGHTRSKHLSNQRYLGTAVLEPSHRMVYLGGYPALVPSDEGSEIHGELYEVDDLCLQDIDKVEGTAHGLFRRDKLKLKSHVPTMLPTDTGTFEKLQNGEVEAYVYCKDVGQARDCGQFWY